MSEEMSLISGAREQQQNKQDEYPDIEEEFSFQNFEKYILNPQENFKEVLKTIKKGDLNDLQIRFGVWRFICNVLPVSNDLEKQKQILLEQRQFYQKNLSELKQSKQPQQAKESKPKPKFNPLAPPPSKKSNQPSPWSGFFEDNELKVQIKKDVERTYQDKEFFSNLKIKGLLSNVLYVWSKLNPEISYIQGMNEIAASCIVIYYQEALETKKEKPENVSQDVYDMANYMINIEYAEADIYHLFNKIMENGQASMFWHKEDPKIKSKQNTPILSRLAKVQDYFLKIIDIDLFRHLKLLEVQFTTFLVRWIRCMFTREFSMHSTFTIWDNIFMDAYLFPNSKFENLTNLNRDNYEINNYFLIDCICVGMFCRIREDVLQIEEGSDAMKAYLHYPPVDKIQELIDLAFEIKESIEKYNPSQQDANAKKKFQVFTTNKSKLRQYEQEEIRQSKQKQTYELKEPTISVIKKSTSQNIKQQPSSSSYQQPSKSPTSNSSNINSQKQITQQSNSNNNNNGRKIDFNSNKNSNGNFLNTPSTSYKSNSSKDLKPKSSNDLDHSKKSKKQQNINDSLVKEYSTSKVLSFGRSQQQQSQSQQQPQSQSSNNGKTISQGNSQTSNNKQNQNKQSIQNGNNGKNNNDVVLSKEQMEQQQHTVLETLHYLQNTQQPYEQAQNLIGQLQSLQEFYLKQLGNQPQINIQYIQEKQNFDSQNNLDNQSNQNLEENINQDYQQQEKSIEDLEQN